MYWELQNEAGAGTKRRRQQKYALGRCTEIANDAFRKIVIQCKFP